MVLPRFVEGALAGRPLRVFGDGRQTRCFGHVLDVVEALRALAGNPAAAGLVFNVGSQEEVSVLELAGRVMDAVGVTLPLEMVPFPDDFREARRRVPDTPRSPRSAAGGRREPRHDHRDVVHERTHAALAAAS